MKLENVLPTYVQFNEKFKSLCSVCCLADKSSPDDNWPHQLGNSVAKI